MTIDLAGGLEPEHNYVFGAAPDNPDMRQGMSIERSYPADKMAQ
jgi:hypothetical protein